MASQSNIYSVQKSGKCIDINAQEIENFMAIQMLMSKISLPSYELHWSKDLPVDCVANVMSLKRYELIRSDKTEKKDDFSRLFKSEPVVHALCTNCLSVAQEQYQSIDKQLVPAETKRSGIRLILPKKIHKWGFFACSGAFEITYDFFSYAGQNSVWREKCRVSEVVLRLVEELLKILNFQLLEGN